MMWEQHYHSQSNDKILESENTSKDIVDFFKINFLISLPLSSQWSEGGRRNFPLLNS